MQEINIVRKKWLTWFLAYNALAIFSFILFSIKKIAEVYLLKKTDLIIQYVYLFPLLLIIISFAFAQYHFAYKKRETKLLLFMIGFISLKRIISLIILIIAIAIIFYLGEWNFTVLYQLIGYGVIETTVSIYFIVNCFRLYKINKSNKYKIEKQEKECKR